MMRVCICVCVDVVVFGSGYVAPVPPLPPPLPAPPLYVLGVMHSMGPKFKEGCVFFLLLAICELDFIVQHCIAHT